MESKKCSKCCVVKPTLDFNNQKTAKDGKTSYCRACSKIAYQKWFSANREHKRANGRKYNREHKEKRMEHQNKWARNNPEKVLGYNKKYLKKNPERYGVRKAVTRALYNGILKRLPCFFCGEKKVQAHHRDYSLPLRVIWLCSQCHYDIHHQKRRYLRMVKP